MFEFRLEEASDAFEASGKVKANRSIRQFDLEALEPRVLLDAVLPTVTAGTVGLEAPNPGVSATIEVARPQSSNVNGLISHSAQAGVDGIFADAYSLPDVVPFQETTASEPSGADTENGTRGVPQVTSQLDQSNSGTNNAGLNTAEEPSSGVEPVINNPMTEQLSETLRAANGSPTGNIVSPNEKGVYAGQVVFLDLDGAENITYVGPITLHGLTIPAFKLPQSLQGQESVLRCALFASLKQSFSLMGVVFTMDQPSGDEYSTIYIGGDGAAFEAYGSFIGLSEKVDIANQDHKDNAFVFSEQLPAVGLTADEYGRILAGYVAHETGHLLGFEHAHSISATTDPLAEVAWKPYTHIEVAIDVRRDLLDDSEITVEGVGYPVNPRAVEAIRRYPAAYYAGAGDDAFPDLVMAQVVLHPLSTGIWVGHVLDKAWEAQASNSPYSPSEQLQILAFAYGFATHAAGDVWGHTLVNAFSEGVFPDFANYTDLSNPLARLNPIRHFIIEGYANDGTPGFDGIKEVEDEIQRSRLPDGDVSSDSSAPREIGAPHEFVYEALLRDLPDLPGDREDFLFPINSDLGARISELDAATFSMALRAQLQNPGGSFNSKAVFLSNSPVTVNVVSAGDVWVIDSDFIELILRREVVAGGASQIAVFRHVQSRGPLLDLFLSLRETLVRLRTGLPNPPNPLDEPFEDQVDDILEAGEQLLRGEDADTDELFDDLKSLGSSLIDAFKQLFEGLANGNSPTDSAILALAGAFGGAGGSDAAAYLDYWIANIDDAVMHWNVFGQAFTKAAFYPQSGRELQNREGRSEGPDAVNPDFPDQRADAENEVGFFDRFSHEIDDPDNNEETNDSFINQYLLPMLGVPRKMGDLRAGISSLGDELEEKFLRPTRELLQDIPNPLDPLVKWVKEQVLDYVKDIAQDVVLETFGVDINFFVFLTSSSLSDLLDLKTISVTVNGETNTLLIFKPGDHDKIDRYMGFIPGTDYSLPLDKDEIEEDLADADASNFVLEFYPNARGKLKANTEFDKEKFAAYANSVTLAKLLLLQEVLPNGRAPMAGFQPKTISKLFSDILGASYDFVKLTLNGVQVTDPLDATKTVPINGGTVMTATLPNVLDPFGEPVSVLSQYRQPLSSDLWITLIDSDHDWRQDSQTRASELYRAHNLGTGGSTVTALAVSSGSG